MQAVIESKQPLIVMIPVQMKRALVALKWQEHRSISDLVREGIAKLLTERESKN